MKRTVHNYGDTDRPHDRGLAPDIVLPKGGGAIHGMGEKFAANPVTGTGSMSVPILTSAGRSGFGPQLAITYDSAAGNGPFGFGWSLSLPAVSRKTQKGLPQYRDADVADAFMLSGAEDLVPVLLRVGGAWLRDILPPRTVYGASYAIHRYRPRVEGLFARIEHWVNTADPSDTFWRSISRNNITTWYGRTAQSRIADPLDSGRIFSWLICESHDDKGNAIVYEYKPENSAGVDLSLAPELNRTDLTRSAQRYLKRIRYGNRVPYRPDLTAPQPTPLPSDWCFEVVLDYGEHDLLAPVPQEASQAWSCRVDPFSGYRAGFEVRSYRLCRRVLMFHHFAGEANVGLDCLVCATVLEHAAGPLADTTQPFYAYLLSATQAGYVRDGAAGYRASSLPPLEFDYTRAEIDETVRDLDAESVRNLPTGLSDATYRWVDLNGEGVSGILTEQGGSWYYKANLSPGNHSIIAGTEVVRPHLGPMQRVARQPSPASLNGDHVHLMDLSGDGELAVVAFDGPTPGYFERTDAQGWARFKRFLSLPVLHWSNPNLRFIDLTGDGLPDLLVTEDSAFCWYGSLSTNGFAAGQRIPRSLNQEAGPQLVLRDSTESIFLADMCGDGLTDLVRIRNGDVCYWPNVGYGRFGAKVTMAGSPRFDSADLFDGTRLRLADIDGSGTADILYFANNAIHLYFNQSGNAWGSRRSLGHFPAIDTASSATVMDLLGNGTACLLWSSPSPATASRPMRYIDLLGGHKPHLLVRARNNMGAETVFKYAPSTRFYVADKLAGTPWLTRLPFPVHVVEQVLVHDYISRSRFGTRYAYHHGYYDGVEREFRGFGRVDQWDTEEISAVVPHSAFPPPSNQDPVYSSPPVCTRTWLHTGAYFGESIVSRQFASEYYDEGDRSGAIAGLSEADKQALLLDDTLLPGTVLLADGSRVPWNFSPQEMREACRALTGSILRQEIYALDGTAAADRPYSTSERNYTIEALQPQGVNLYGVFVVHAREAIDFHYERALYTVLGNQLVDPAAPPPGARAACDPRVTHALTLAVDSYGNVLRSAAVAYGRRYLDPSLAPQDQRTQAATLGTCEDATYTNAVLTQDAYRAPALAQSSRYELLQLPRSGAPAGVAPLLGFAQLADAIQAAGDGAHDIPFEAPDTVPVEPGQTYRRMIARTRAYYRPDDMGAAASDTNARLALGILESLALQAVHFQLVFTPGLVSRVYRRGGAALLPVPADVLANVSGDGGGYTDLDGDGHWWQPSSRVFYLPAAATSAAEQAEAQAHFYVPRRTVDPFGHATSVNYDGQDLLPLQSTDAVGNSVTATYDYRVLSPLLVTDANGNRSAVAFDALGRVAGVAVMGKGTEQRGDSLTGFSADLTVAELDTFQAADDPHTLATTLLGSATTRIVYDPLRFLRSRRAFPDDPSRWLPVFAATLSRETHASDLGQGQLSRIQLGFAYGDGFGRTVQHKVHAEPGPVAASGPVIDPRWVGSGWTLFNNKGQPVRQYEPFFSALAVRGHQFEFGVQAGVSPIIFYDPMGRAVATLHPDHTYEKVVFDPWHQYTWDATDTVLVADPSSDPDVSGFLGLLARSEFSPTWYAQRIGAAANVEEQGAAIKAAAHANTPGIRYFDTLGRAFLAVADNAAAGKYLTRTELDAQGLQRSMTDALDRRVVAYDYEMLGGIVHQASMEAGERWTLSDVMGNAIRAWDARGHNHRTAYDVLRRPTDVFVLGTDNVNSDPRTLSEVRYHRWLYGEGLPGDVALNLRTRVYAISDTAGVVTHMDVNPVSGLREAYDFKGNLLRARRQFVVDHRLLPDWTAPPPMGEAFAVSTQYDALNRPIVVTAPDASITRLSYNATGSVEGIAVKLRGSASETPFITNIDYDAKGQRTLIDHGNGARTFYAYDPLTLRLARLLTRRDPAAFAGDCPQPPPAGWPGCQVQNIGYTYDPVGNVTSIRDNAQQAVYFRNQRVEPSNGYTYDALYRLTQATGREHLGQGGNGATLPSTASSYHDAPRIGHLSPGDGNAMGIYTEQYQYDPAGNFLKLIHRGSQPSHPGWTRTYAYGEASLLEPGKVSNRLTQTTLSGTQALSETYRHDKHGSMTSMPQLRAMQWNFKDQLRMSQRQALDNSDSDGVLKQGEQTYYIYDGTGQRARKVTETSEGIKRNERFYLGGFEIYRSYDNSGAVTLEREALHVMQGGQRVALVETRTHGDDGSPAQLIRYQLSNHLGSTCVELDGAAQVISYEEYCPYGNTSYQAGRSAVEASLKRYRYTGMERDEESGLSYHGARYCATWLGRWTGCDPVAAVNLYGFSNCNPVNLIDPQGTEPKKPKTGAYEKVKGDHVHQVAPRTKKVGDRRNTAPQFKEANAISTRDPNAYNDPAAQKVEAAINRAQWGAHMDDYHPAGQNGQKVKTASGGKTTESVVKITSSGATTVGSKRAATPSSWFEDVKSYYKLREGGLPPDAAKAEVFKSAEQLEQAGAAPTRVPDTPADFRKPSAPPVRANEPSVFRRGANGLEPVKTTAPEPPVTVKQHGSLGGSPGNVRSTGLQVAAIVVPKVVESTVRRLGGDHTTVRRAGFLATVGTMALIGAEMGAPADGIGALPGAVLGGIIGALSYGFDGLMGEHTARSNPVLEIETDENNPYPTGAQWGDPTVQ
ncbi:SpvB/TcaC N-terminal domain-containing protein [Pseudomonas japonica]|uniref:SpvB/TcaC N-terminal domain-containing protein n=1 Tax=Pseudomonas japonica TaxID=256466 RepID=UPI0015E39443|nr:SpvB/TcaC N-terminal domain-containing protein [Pseudomonas japonica]MBA1288460.1 toxin [Pseudomonas japonica]